jgi:hypothetical protein
VILLMLLLTWLVVSVPVSLVLGRAMRSGADVHLAEPQRVADWRRAPAAA